ncbi:MAG: hypothetical protein ABWY93_19260 [Mycobacterium sp.]
MLSAIEFSRKACPLNVAARLALGTLLVAGVTVGGASTAVAEPFDYAALPVDPNIVTDSTAYSAAPALLNPDGQPGVATVFTHRDNTREVSDTILVLADPVAARDALQQQKSNLAAVVANQAVQQVPVGEGGMLISGSSPGGAQSVSVLLFAQGNAVARVEFTGAPDDPAPNDFVIDYGQQQANAIQQQLG